MNRKQKQALARAVIHEAAKLVEFWDELAEGYGLEDIDPTEGAQQIANWLGRLPGDAWSVSLPKPSN